MKLLTVREVAETLRVRENSVYRWINQGRMKQIKVGRSVRIDEKELERFVKAK